MKKETDFDVDYYNDILSIYNRALIGLLTLTVIAIAIVLVIFYITQSTISTIISSIFLFSIFGYLFISILKKRRIIKNKIRECNIED